MADYCTLAWFRSHGFEIDDYPDEVVNTAIRESSLFIDDFTGMWFDERIKTFKLDGSGTNFMYFAIPIVSISEVNYTNPVTGDTQELTVATDVAIYNRDYPDDRLNPKIRLNSGTGVFPVGKMNIEVKGVFGFTVEDSDIFGPTVCSGVVDGENTTFTVSEGAYVAGTLTPYVDDVEQSGFSETDPENGIFNLTVPPEEGAEVTSKFQKTEDDTQPADFEVYCQWVPKEDLKLSPVAAGDSPQSLGYIVVRTRDVEKKLKDFNGKFKKGDLILTVGGEDVNATIVEVENHSHYHGKPQLKFLKYENEGQGR